MRLLASGFVFFAILGFAACSSSDPQTPITHDAAVVDSATRIDDSNKIPCGPRLVLQTVCQNCHTYPPKNGAPFPLVTFTDVMTDRGNGVTRDLMIAQLVARRMPLAPITIQDEQRTTLLTWLQAGAEPVPPQTCSDAGTDTDSGSDAGADATDAADADDADGGADATID